jgi:hypothetical protein
MKCNVIKTHIKVIYIPAKSNRIRANSVCLVNGWLKNFELLNVKQLYIMQISMV